MKKYKKHIFVIFGFFIFVFLQETYFYFKSLYFVDLFKKDKKDFVCEINNKDIIFENNNSKIVKVSFYYYISKNKDFSKIYKCESLN